MKRALCLVVFFLGCRAAPSGSGAAVSAGCLPSAAVDPLAAVRVGDAHLEGLTLWQAGLASGHAEGDATLVIHDTVGNESRFDARLDGSHVGLTADASVDLGNGSYELQLPPGGTIVTARQLLGVYQGPHVGLDVGIGGHWRNLKNSAGVLLNVTTLSFGIGTVPASFESMDLELWDDPLQPSAGEGEGEGEGSSAVEEAPPACSDADTACNADCCPGLTCRPIEEDRDGAVVVDRCRVACDDPAVPCADGEACVLGPLGTSHDCAVLVAATTSHNLDAPPPCDVVSDVRYCDQSMFDGAASPGFDVCYQSMCLPLCVVPAVDRDQDGVIGAGDVTALRFDCGATFTCTTAVAVALGLTEDVWQKNADGSSSARPCTCPEGAPCPDECGRDDAVCHDALCVAPYGTCEPAPAP